MPRSEPPDPPATVRHDKDRDPGTEWRAASIGAIRAQELRLKMVEFIVSQLEEESERPLGDRYALKEAIDHGKNMILSLVKYKDPYL